MSERFRIVTEDVDAFACEECEEENATRIVTLRFPSLERGVRVGAYCEPCADRISEALAQDIDDRRGGGSR